MIDNGQQRNAKNYQLALQHLERFLGTTQIMFSHLTSHLMNRWIKSLEQTHRAKEMYPICMRQVFKAAILEYNDYDNGIIRIKTNPWVKVEIPSADRAEKLAITPEACREFFSFPLPESKMKYPQTEFGRDIAMMVLCLAGINTVDLYNLKSRIIGTASFTISVPRQRSFVPTVHIWKCACRQLFNHSSINISIRRRMTIVCSISTSV